MDFENKILFVSHTLLFGLLLIATYSTPDVTHFGAWGAAFILWVIFMLPWAWLVGSLYGLIENIREHS